MAEAVLEQPDELPVGPGDRRGLGHSGVMMLVASEAALFGYLLFAYYYTGAVNGRGWLLEPHPKIAMALGNTLLLLASSVAAAVGERGIARRRRGQAIAGLGVAFVMGCIFFGVQLVEWRGKPFGFGTSSYASLYYVTTGAHLAHVLVGLLILFALTLWTALDYFSPRRRLTVSAGVLYWHFVDAIWLCVFATYYVSPSLGFGQW